MRLLVFLFLLLPLSLAASGVKLGSASVGSIPTVPFTFTAPFSRQIVQRDGSNMGSIPIAGLSARGTSARAQATPIGGYAGTQTDWQSISIVGGALSGYLTAAAGWYSVEVRIYEYGVLISDAVLAKAGVGDLFPTAGQSNFADYNKPLDSTPPDDQVNCRGITGADPWRLATDPQPTADNTFSSVFPRLGNLIAAHTGFPVGFISVGLGNTSVADWTPGGANYSRIHDALAYFPGTNGFRAFLWHQGENDGANATTRSDYKSALESIIDQIRADAGWQVPCGIAIATHPNETAGANVILAQTDVGTTYPGCFQGADTDTLDNTYRYDTIHFNTTSGTAAHANLWYQAIISALSL